MSGSFTSILARSRNSPAFSSPVTAKPSQPIANIGRRAVARLRLSIPAQIITVCETRRCILLDLSRTGARIGLETALNEGDCGFLDFAGYEAFCTVLRASPGVNGLQFDVPLTDADVLAVRAYVEQCEGDERRQWRAEVEAWVKGGPAAR